MKAETLPAVAEGEERVVEWGRDYRKWTPVSGFVKSRSHGNRLVRTYIDPPEAAEIFKANAALVRVRKFENFGKFPVGTRIVQESWSQGKLGGPGPPGPIFFMRKEAPGYNTAGGDWYYVLAKQDLTIIGEGSAGQVAFCKQCHDRAKSRDFIFASR